MSKETSAHPTDPSAGVVQGERVYAFGDYRLVPQRQLLLRGNYPVRIGGRALDLLRLLVERQGELVSKEQLLGFAWPDTFVHESNLKVNIAALRRALPQPRSELPYIATVPGRGYRFVAPVRIESSTTLPPLAQAAGAQADNLPPEQTLFGRDEDLAELAEKLVETSFLTIVGPAGVGKTSVAIALARAVADHHADGIRFVDLAAVGDARLVCPAIAAALGSGGAFPDMLPGVVEALRGRRKLLILDNCEHVLSAVTTIAEHLHTALPELSLIATSREPLRSKFERVHVLAPLRLPTAQTPLSPDEALGFAAVELFVARANEASGFDLDQAEASTVVEICRRLDGIPLAIELAASRLSTFAPALLLLRLGQSFDFLICGPRDAPSRHQALTATLDWSYRLLSDQEAQVLRLISVFAGGFTLDDAVAFCAQLALPAEDVARGVASLATKSLLSSRFADGQLRYRLLEATRCYATERLRHAGQEAEALRAHADFLRQVFQQAEVEWGWRTGQDWTERYAWRLNDLRKAIDWALANDPALAIALTASAIPLWDELSLVGESRVRVQRALRQTQALAHLDPVLLMKLTVANAWSHTFSDQLGPDAEAAWRESLRLARDTGSIDYELRALWGMAVFLSFTGRHRQALASLEAFEAIAEREHDQTASPDGDRLRAVTAFYCGDIEGAYADLSALAKAHGAVNHRARIARFQLDRYVAIRASLAIVAWTRGCAAEGQSVAAAALAGALAIGHDVSQSNALALAALPIALWEGQLDLAQSHLSALTENLNRHDIGIWRPISRFFSGAIRHAQGDPTGLEAMDDALSELEDSNFCVRLPLYATMLGQAALDSGRLDVALAALETAQQRIEAQEELWSLPEVLRLRGLVEQREGASACAEETLLRAIEKAEMMGAQMFALRGATNLAEIWATTARGAQAVDLLADTLARFNPEGQGRDLTTARRLLKRLRNGGGPPTEPAT